MRAIMFKDEIAIRVLEIDGHTLLMGLDVLQAAGIQPRHEHQRYLAR